MLQLTSVMPIFKQIIKKNKNCNIIYFKDKYHYDLDLLFSHQQKSNFTNVSQNPIIAVFIFPE